MARVIHQKEGKSANALRPPGGTPGRCGVRQDRQYGHGKPKGERLHRAMPPAGPLRPGKQPERLLEVVHSNGHEKSHCQ
jgi:hypothetical protein